MIDRVVDRAPIAPHSHSRYPTRVVARCWICGCACRCVLMTESCRPLAPQERVERGYDVLTFLVCSSAYCQWRAVAREGIRLP